MRPHRPPGTGGPAIVRKPVLRVVHYLLRCAAGEKVHWNLRSAQITAGVMFPPPACDAWAATTPRSSILAASAASSRASAGWTARAGGYSSASYRRFRRFSSRRLWYQSGYPKADEATYKPDEQSRLFGNERHRRDRKSNHEPATSKARISRVVHWLIDLPPPTIALFLFLQPEQLSSVGRTLAPLSRPLTLHYSFNGQAQERVTAKPGPGDFPCWNAPRVPAA